MDKPQLINLRLPEFFFLVCFLLGLTVIWKHVLGIGYNHLNPNSIIYKLYDFGQINLSLSNPKYKVYTVSTQRLISWHYWQD